MEDQIDLSLPGLFDEGCVDRPVVVEAPAFVKVGITEVGDAELFHAFAFFSASAFIESACLTVTSGFICKDARLLCFDSSNPRPG